MYENCFNSQTDDDETGVELRLPDDLRRELPNLYLALCGRVGSKKSKTRSISPATLIIFARDEGIGFVIAPKDSPKNAHGFVREPIAILAQIEQELEAGRIGWKVPSRKRS